jgi:phosphatidylserine/phosphatidylglycerophosphate/cardiolipin synthase-like enzyme
MRPISANLPATTQALNYSSGAVMTIEARVFANCNETTIVWRCDAPIKDCLGFALHRETKDANGKLSETAVQTLVGFANDANAKPGTMQPSTTWPIQRYIWSDYFAGGDQVRYQVVPMLGKPGALKPSDDISNWTEWVSVGTGKSKGFSAWFNRGMIASQWVARDTAKGNGSPSAVLNEDIKEPGNALREELSGQLLPALRKLLTDAKQDGLTLYAALYELNDPELIALLKGFDQRCNLILGSGAYKAGEKDENADVRADLIASKTINVYDRLVGSPHFAHNKFLVFCDGNGQPQKLWTGSTNWTVNGLCTQVNNGILVEDPGIAQVYLKRWQSLKAAENSYPAKLSEEGSVPGRSQLGAAQMTAWNAPVNGLVDLTDARRLIQGARQGVLFLMFNPGPQGTLLNDILALKEDNLYIHGVVNQDPGGAKAPILTLYNRGNTIDADPEVAVPTQIKNVMNHWFQDESRGNMVMVHSKVILIDPFGPHPVLMTGSHNMGPKASSKNDDNLLIIENAPGLAAEYAVHIMGVFGHYKYRHNLNIAKQGTAQQKQQSSKWAGLESTDEWQQGYFEDAKLREINFWFGEIAPHAS